MSFLTSGRRSTRGVEALERRLALEAPLALTDDGLVLSAPEDGEAWLDPGINEELATADSTTTSSYTSYPPPPPTQPPFSYSTGRVVSGTNVAESELPSPGSFSFEVTSNFGNGAPAPTSATIVFSLTGEASPGEDYTGPLTAGSVTIPLDASGYGFKSVEYTAFDDELMEPQYESVIVTVTGGSVSSGTFSGSGSITTFAKSDDAEASPVTIDVGAGKEAEVGSVKLPDGTSARQWKIKKITAPAGVASPHDDITLGEQKPGLQGKTDVEYKIGNIQTPPGPGTSRVYDVTLVDVNGGDYKAVAKVTVKG